jgi:predicted DNA-binding transcriptional regulator YafY
MPRQGNISETLYRHWQMLRLIPRSPRKIDAGALERLLRQEGIEVHRRSIQRDLESLATSFNALQCDERTKPYGWSWARDAPLLDVPPMSLQAAVTLDLVRAHLVEVLPRTTLRSLGPYFERAHEILSKSPGAKFARWPRKVRVVGRGVPLIPPNVSTKVLDVVYASLLEERRFRARYRTRGSSVEKDYEVSPLGLVVRNGALVLVCTFRDYEDIRHVLLHRMSDAELLDSPSRPPRGFDLDAHLGEGGVAFPYGRPLRIEALVTSQVVLTLRETPIARDQKLTPQDGDRLLLRATVPDTLELRGFLMAYGANVEVLAPSCLREEIARATREAAKLYESVRAREPPPP